MLVGNDMKLENVIICKIGQPNPPTGRIYPKKVIKDVVENQKEYLSVLSLEDPSSGGTLVTNSLEYVSHSVSNLRIENDNLLCDVKIFDTPQGKILKELITSGSGRFGLCGYGTIFGDMVKEYSLTQVPYYYSA